MGAFVDLVSVDAVTPYGSRDRLRIIARGFRCHVPPSGPTHESLISRSDHFEHRRIYLSGMFSAYEDRADCLTMDL